jgi:hypothetical protein
VKLPAWARGPYELIKHAEDHYRGEADVDRRIALIGFDNAIEVTITTYLQLNPKLRGGAAFRKDDVRKWLRNYHTKIEFFEGFAKNNDLPVESSIAEVIWYHTLRNELYHSGNGMVPERRCLDGARDAAIEVFKVLFGIDVTTLLEASRAILTQAERDTRRTATIQNRFLQSYIAFERALRASALAMGFEVDSRAEGDVRLWDAYKAQVGRGLASYDLVVRNARQARNELVHTGLTERSEDELERLIGELDELTVFLQSYGFSLDLLPTLKQRYGDWVRTEISSVRVIHKQESAFLEVTSAASGLFDEEVRRVDLNFIVSDDEPLFSPTRRAQENADCFFDKFDLYSIVMTGIGDLLFTADGMSEAVKLSGANGTGPKGEITSKPTAEGADHGAS